MPSTLCLRSYQRLKSAQRPSRHTKLLCPTPPFHARTHGTTSPLPTFHGIAWSHGYDCIASSASKRCRWGGAWEERDATARFDAGFVYGHAIKRSVSDRWALPIYVATSIDMKYFPCREWGNGGSVDWTERFSPDYQRSLQRWYNPGYRHAKGMFYPLVSPSLSRLFIYSTTLLLSYIAILIAGKYSFDLVHPFYASAQYPFCTRSREGRHGTSICHLTAKYGRSRAWVQRYARRRPKLWGDVVHWL